MTNTCARLKGRNLPVPAPPWAMFLFLALMFFLAGHDFYYSVKRMGVFDPTENEQVTTVSEGSLRCRIGYLGLGMLGAVCLLRKSRTRFKVRGALAWLMLSYVAWVSSSLAWAQDGALTFRRLVILGMMCLCALGVSRRLSSRHIVAWILFSTAAYLLIGLLAESVLGSFHPFAPGHRFAGTIHPNLQGLNCALLALSGAAASRTRWRSRNFFRALGLIGFVFLVLTGSRTAFGATVLALLFYWSLVWPRLRTFAVTYSAITILVFLLFVGGGAFLPVLQRAALLGRESSSAGTLSGRILVWQECLGYVANRPFQGYGYGGFWTPIHISEISATQGWGVAEAHSAYLDLLLTVGLIGLVIFILMLAVAISRSVACYRLSQNPAYAFFAALLFLCALEGLMESTVATRSMFSFACMLALANLSFRDAPTGRQTASP